MNYSREFDNALVQHRKTELLRGNPFSSLWFPGWRRPLVTQIGSTRADWSGWAYSNIPSGLAHEGRTQRNPRWMGRTPFTVYRSPQLWLSGSLFRLHQGDIHWRERDGIGWRSIHQTGGCEQMWVFPSWTLSWANGSHWWRRQNSDHLSMMVALVGQMLTSSRTAQRRQRHLRWWIVSMVSTDFRQPVMLQTRALLHREPVALTPCQKGSVWHWPKNDSTFLLLKADVSKAHRRIKILKSGWKYQVAQID